MFSPLGARAKAGENLSAWVWRHLEYSDWQRMKDGSFQRDKSPDDLQTWTEKPRMIFRYEQAPNTAIKKIIIECTYAGLRVSKRVRSIWITLTMAESFFSLSKMFDSNCSTVSCLKRKTNSQFSTTALACLKLELNFNPSKYATFQKVTRKNCIDMAKLTSPVWPAEGQAPSSPAPGTFDLCSAEWSHRATGTRLSVSVRREQAFTVT